MDAERGTTAEETPRRGCFGCALTSGLGCGAFFVGAATASLLFAPRLLGDFAAYFVEQYLNEGIAGEIQVDSFELAWTREQRLDLKLLEPNGDEVLIVDARLPSLFRLAEVDEGLLDFDVRVTRADIRIDEDGVSNVERSLRPVDGSASRTWEFDGDVGRRDAGLDFARRFRVGLRVDLLNVVDARRPGPATEIRDLELELECDPSSDLSVRGEASVECETRGRLELELRLYQPSGTRWTGVDGKLSVDALPAGAIELLPSAGERLVRLLGPGVTGEVSVSGSLADGAPMQGEWSSGAARARLDGLLVRDGLRAGETGLTGDVAVPEELARAMLAPLAPAGATFSYRAGDDRWAFSAPVFELPFAWTRPVAYARPRGGAPATGEIEWVHAGAIDLALPGGTVCGLSGVALRAARTQDKATVDVVAGVERPVGEGVLVERVLARLRYARPDATKLAGFAVEAPSLPSALVGAYAAADLARAFGPDLFVSLDVPLTGETAPFRVAVRGADGSLTWRGVRAHGVYETGELGAFEATLSAADALDACGDLLPWVADFEGALASVRPRVVAERVSFTPERGVAGLTAVGWFDPGALDYRLVGPLARLFHAADVDERWTDELPPLRFDVADGVLGYKGQTTRIAGRDASVSGTVDLATGRVSFELGVPVGLLARRFGLDPGLSNLLDRSGAVPIQLTGERGALSTAIGTDALRTILTEGWRSMSTDGD